MSDYAEQIDQTQNPELSHICPMTEFSNTKNKCHKFCTI